CQAYFKSGNAYRAYLEAYDVDPKTHRSTVDSNASKLLNDAKIASGLQMLRDRAEEQAMTEKQGRSQAAEYTVENISSSLEDVRDRALASGNYSAAVAAIMGMAKVNGLLTVKNMDASRKPHQSRKQIQAQIDRLLEKRARVRQQH
ncbi:MAG: hypothetical protein ACR2PG_02025, partial [Hyphomicrobiaceae bacterium]